MWAIIQGEFSDGISLFRIEDGVDTGDLIAQESVPILFMDTIVTLYKRIERTGLCILCETLPKYLAGNLLPRAQEDRGKNGRSAFRQMTELIGEDLH